MNIFAPFANPVLSFSSPFEQNVNLFPCWYKSRIKYDFSSCRFFRYKTERMEKCPRGIKYRKPFLFTANEEHGEESFSLFGIFFLLANALIFFSLETDRDSLFYTSNDVYYRDNFIRKKTFRKLFLVKFFDIFFFGFSFAGIRENNLIGNFPELSRRKTTSKRCNNSFSTIKVDDRRNVLINTSRTGNLMERKQS